MATPPAASNTKKGLGCCGCGCAILAVIVFLILGAVGAGAYFVYNALDKASSPTPLEIAAFPADPQAYAAVQARVNDFQQNIEKHQPATLTLTADDLNTLIVNDPDIKSNNIKAHLTIKDDTGMLEASVPTDTIGILKGRYFNVDTTFTVQFDNAAKNIILTPSSFVFGGTDYLGGTYKSSAPNIIVNLNASLNRKLHEDPKCNAFLNQLTSVTVKDGQVVLEAK
jgi:hypothetical protein